MRKATSRRKVSNSLTRLMRAQKEPSVARVSGLHAYIAVVLFGLLLLVVWHSATLLLRGVPPSMPQTLSRIGIVFVVGYVLVRVAGLGRLERKALFTVGVAGVIVVSFAFFARHVLKWDVMVSPAVGFGVVAVQFMGVGQVSLVGLLVGLSCGSFVEGLSFGAGAATAALIGRKIDTRTKTVFAGALGGVAQTAVLLLLTLATVDGWTPKRLALRVAWSLGGGVGWGLLMTGVLPFIERIFNLATPMRLRELADLNQPFFRRFLLEAPGTYHHSVLVGSLAEAAADVVGADPLLARVGGYYHDIGKLTKPTYFAENIHGQSRHEKLSPPMSALVIVSHVRDGVEMGKELGLPQPVVDVIAQHHGTCVVEYFYYEALKEARANGSTRVDVARYRYPGPKPQTKEAAIVMLADAVEAASRALKSPSSARVAELVHELVMRRLLDGQLDESPLTLREIHKIEQTMTRMLQGLFHTRIPYPSREETADGVA